MSLQEIYGQMHGNYDSVMKRLLDEARVKKYLLKFMDYKYDELIIGALKSEDYETAFREAHNLKGICANLSMDALGSSSSQLTEALRGGKPEYDISTLVDAMKKDYDMTINALKQL